MSSSKVIVSRSPNCSMDDVIGSYFTSVARRSLETIIPFQQSSHPSSACALLTW